MKINLRIKRLDYIKNLQEYLVLGRRIANRQEEIRSKQLRREEKQEQLRREEKQEWLREEREKELLLLLLRREERSKELWIEEREKELWIEEREKELLLRKEEGKEIVLEGTTKKGVLVSGRDGGNWGQFRMNSNCRFYTTGAGSGDGGSGSGGGRGKETDLLNGVIGKKNSDSTKNIDMLKKMLYRKPADWKKRKEDKAKLRKEILMMELIDKKLGGEWGIKIEKLVIPSMLMEDKEFMKEFHSYLEMVNICLSNPTLKINTWKNIYNRVGKMLELLLVKMDPMIREENNSMENERVLVKIDSTHCEEMDLLLGELIKIIEIYVTKDKNDKYVMVKNMLDQDHLKKLYIELKTYQNHPLTTEKDWELIKNKYTKELPQNSLMFTPKDIISPSIIQIERNPGGSQDLFYIENMFAITLVDSIHHYSVLVNTLLAELDDHLSVIIQEPEDNLLLAAYKNLNPSLTRMFSQIFKFQAGYLEQVVGAKVDNTDLHFLIDLTVKNGLNSSNMLYECLKNLNTNPSTKRSDILDNNSNLFKTIYSILWTVDLSAYTKQFLIENLLIEFETTFFSQKMEGDSYSKDYLLFKKVYTNVKKNVSDLKANLMANNCKQLSISLLNNSIQGRVNLLLILYDQETLINIISTSAVRLLINKHTATKQEVCAAIGKAIINYTHMVDHPLDPKFVALLPKNCETNICNIYFESFESIQIGLIGWELLEARNDLFNIEVITDKNVSQTFISLQSNWVQLFMGVGVSLMKLPMISKPIVWDSTNKDQGGYITNGFKFFINKNNNFIHNNPLQLQHSIPHQLQYDTINYLNSQPFKINSLLLDKIILEWDKPNGIFGALNKKHPLDNKKGLSKAEKKMVQEHNGQYWLLRNTLNIAILYQNLEFFLPTFMDFRGRIYPEVSYFNYQGSDLARALILFSVTSTYIDSNSFVYIKLYMANVYGAKLNTQALKINWFDKHYPKFKDVYLTEPDFFISDIVLKAKEPFQFWSSFNAAMAFDNGQRGGDLPILFDCSCSGIQHLSALCSDISMAKMVNVVSTEYKSDVYELAAKEVTALIKNSDNPKIVNARNNLSLLVINRTIMKIPIMTIPYNISLEGIKEQITETLIEDVFWELKYPFYKVKSNFVRNNQNLILTGAEFSILCSIIYNSLYQLAPPIKKLIKYFDSMINVFNTVEIPITWITPANLHINLSTAKFKSIKSSSHLHPKSKPITISVPTYQLDKKSNSRAFMANLIHSLDAAHINILIRDLSLDKLDHIPLYTIHDCFATTPKDMNILNDKILGAFIELYFSKNYILKLHRNLLEQLGSYNLPMYEDETGIKVLYKDDIIKIPNVPTELLDKWEKNKTMFIEGIKKSRYFIS